MHMPNSEAKIVPEGEEQQDDPGQCAGAWREKAWLHSNSKQPWPVEPALLRAPHSRGLYQQEGTAVKSQREHFCIRNEMNWEYHRSLALGQMLGTVRGTPLPFWMLVPHIRVPVPKFHDSNFLLLTHVARQQVTAQVVGSLPPTWETQS